LIDLPTSLKPSFRMARLPRVVLPGIAFANGRAGCDPVVRAGEMRARARPALPALCRPARRGTGFARLRAAERVVRPLRDDRFLARIERATKRRITVTGLR